MLLAFVRLILALCTVFTCLAAPASAAQILVLGDDGRTRPRADPGVAARGESVPRAPGASREPRAGANRSGRRAAASRKSPRRTVGSELRRLRDGGLITFEEFETHRDAFREARSFARRLPAGRRRIEMFGAVRLLRRAAAEGWMTLARVRPLWLTLARNREWWSQGPLLTAGQRVGFQGSQTVWQYVPGQGLHLHPLANFGKLNALWRSQRDRRMARLLDEMLALPAERAGGLAWEYYFAFGGGRAPWVSGLAQGTGLQAVSRAATALGRAEEVLPVAARGLRIFETPPPSGVRVAVGGDAHYLIYSFDRSLRVINGFVQALVGLHDFAELAGDARAAELFAAGDRRARVEVPRYDTGAWSMYSQSRESDLSYHKLLTGFLSSLCERTLEPAYCSTRDNFTRYLGEPPRMSLVTRRLRGRTRGLIRFDLSKISDVTVRVSRGRRTFHTVSMRMGGGRQAVAWQVPRRPRRYSVRISAVDLAGNAGAAEGTVRVLRPRKARRKQNGG